MQKNRALLLDRDGVINDDSSFVGTIDRFAFMPGLFPFLRAARHLGFRLIILTNQSGVARGLYSEEDYEKLTTHMLNELRREAIEIDLVLACFEHAAGSIPPYARQSFWRKPNPGMVLEAIHRMELAPSRSAFIGDNLTDMQAAEKGGIAKRLWLTQKNDPAPEGVAIVRNFEEALNKLRVRT